MIVYTVITNDYDTLRDPRVVTPGWRYVCFSDQPIESDVWEFHKIGSTPGADREVKIMGHKFFNEVALYLAGHFHIKKDLLSFVSQISTPFSIPVHKLRCCLYQEAAQLIHRGIVPSSPTQGQMERYRLEGFPPDFGLGANGIMLRDLSDPKVQAVNELWWDEWKNGIKRDQLSLMYCFWKKGWKPSFFPQTQYKKFIKKVKHNETKEKILVVD